MSISLHESRCCGKRDWITPFVLACTILLALKTNVSLASDNIPEGPGIATTSAVAGDRAWAQVNTGNSVPEQKAAESSLTYFLRRVELYRQHLRGHGLEFWRMYPDDPRRYKWLLLTVAMPPRYPVDIEKWARSESLFTANTAAVDAEEVFQWLEIYPSLREEFWHAAEVDDQQRRYLWLSELQQQIYRKKEAYARGEDVSLGPLLDEILELSSRFREPLSVDDENQFNAMFSALLDLVYTEVGEMAGWSRQSATDFWDRFTKTENEIVDIVLDDIHEGIQDLSNGEAVSEEIRDVSTSVWDISEPLPYPMGSPRTYEGRVVYHHDFLISKRMYREIGVQTWDSQEDNVARGSWIIQTLHNPPAYAKHFGEAIHQLAARDYFGVEVDQDAIETWSQFYSKARAEFWGDPRTTDIGRGEVRSFEVRFQFRDAQRKWAVYNDREAVSDLLYGIHDLYTTFEHRKAASILRRLIRSKEQFGLTDAAILDFMGELEFDGDPRMQRVYEVAQNWIVIKSTPFVFSAPTLDGQPFDIADLRGKIVLVDHWATTCASCIDAMPLLRDVYEAYRGAGFEVVSIAYDAEERRNRVLRIKNELGLTWTTLVGDRQWEDIAAKYGYSGFPQYMLLNRDGTLYAGSGEVDLGRNLARLLDEMLAAE